MSFTIVIYWNPADEIPWELRLYTSKPFSTKREAWAYVQRVIERAELSEVQLHDIAVFSGAPRNIVIDDDNLRVYDPALWRLHGRNTSYRAMFY